MKKLLSLIALVLIFSSAVTGQFSLDDKALVTINGTEYNLTIPSKTIKLIKGFNIDVNKTTTLTLDFDAQKSIHSSAKDKYIMRPTIKVIQD